MIMRHNNTTNLDMKNLETVQNKKKSILEYVNILIYAPEPPVITSTAMLPVAPFYFHHHALDTLKGRLP